MNKSHNPPTVAAPAGNYSQGIEVPPNARWLFIAGQLGMTPDGKLSDGIDAQAAQAFANIVAMLAAAGMGPADLVKMTIFLTDERSIPVMRTAREKVLGGARPASTLLVVKALASPEFLIEVEAVAARA